MAEWERKHLVTSDITNPSMNKTTGKQMPTALQGFFYSTQTTIFE